MCCSAGRKLGLQRGGGVVLVLLRSARCQHLAIRQDGGVHLDSRLDHVRAGSPLRRRDGQVDQLRGRGGRRTGAAHDHDHGLEAVRRRQRQEHRCAVVAVALEDGVGDEGVGPGRPIIHLGVLIRPGHEDLPIGKQVLAWIQLDPVEGRPRRRPRAPGPDLHGGIYISVRIVQSRRDQHVTVADDEAVGIRAALIGPHLGRVRESLRRRVESGGLRLAEKRVITQRPPQDKWLPSGKITIPLQNMSQDILNVLMVSDLGSQTAAWRFLLSGSLPDPEMINTLPVCIRATCTGLSGISKGSVSHRPFRLRLVLTCAMSRALVLCDISDGSMKGFRCSSCAKTVGCPMDAMMSRQDAENSGRRCWRVIFMMSGTPCA